jgi:hypothetical protein
MKLKPGLYIRDVGTTRSDSCDKGIHGTQTWHRPKERERLVPVGERVYGVYPPKHSFGTQEVLDMQHHQAW